MEPLEPNATQLLEPNTANQSDQIRPNPTDLNFQQLQAIDLFAKGQKVGRIAEELGINRDTLWRWRRQERFAAELVSAQRQQRERLRDQTAELLRLSMLAITRELTKAETSRDNPWKAALRTLNFISHSGLMQNVAPGDAAWYEAPETPEFAEEEYRELPALTQQDKDILHGFWHGFEESNSGNAAAQQPSS